MFRSILAGILLLLLQGPVPAQNPIRGVVLKPIDRYSPGDTLSVYGYKKKIGGREFYLVRSGGSDKHISSSRFRLLTENLGYWQEIWLRDQASHIYSNGWQEELRLALQQDYYEYVSQMEINGLVFRDEYLEDYLRQLVYIIHPESLMKSEPSRLNILLIRAKQPETFVFNSGTIVLTTGLIARTNSEKDLLGILAEQTSHIVLDHNLMNLDQEIHGQRSAEFWSTFATLASAVAMEFSNLRYGTDFTFDDVVLAGLTSVAISDGIKLSSGSKFSAEQEQQAQRLGMEFITKLENNGSFEYLPVKEYMINISSVLSLTAWQEYHHNNFDRSMFYVDRIFDLGIANEEDYLLMAKLKRTLSNSPESNLEALQLINTALAMNDFDFVEALAEKGLILIRLGEVAQAREIFEEYRTAVAGMPEMPPGRDATWARRMLIKCDQLMLKR